MCCAKDFGSRVYDSYQKQLLRTGKGQYRNFLFELQVGCMLKTKDPDFEFHELESTQKKQPDFRGRYDDEDIWVDAYVRETKDFFAYFTDAKGNFTGPKPNDEIVEIESSSTMKTAKKIGNHRKHVPKKDTFVYAVRTIDRYLAGKLDFQLLVNDLPNGIIVHFSGFWFMHNKPSLEKVKVYFNEETQLHQRTKDYILDLFSR